MIRIDPEFQAYVPPLTEEEKAQLEANLVADGCRDPLVVWNDVIIDGHNRYEICERLGLGYRTVSRDFESREAALDWMDAAQLGRRNLSPDARRLLLGRRYNRLKRTPTDNLVQYSPKDQNDPSVGSTAAKLAHEHGVSEATVKRAGRFAEEVEADDTLKAAVAAGVPVAKVRPAPKVQAPVEKREPNGLSGMTREGLEDEVVGLRAENADLRKERDALKAERDDFRARWKEATAEDQGKAIGNLQRQLVSSKSARDDAMAAAKRLEYRLKQAEKRVAELESAPIDMGA